MSAPSRFSRRDWLIAAALLVGGVWLRVPFHTHYAYHWDGVQFALAMHQYSVALSQPHAPGYYLYVALGRLVDRFLDDPAASLVWLNTFTSSGVAALLYILGVTLFEDRRVGWAAGLFALTSPQFWFHGCVAQNYATDAFLVCGLAAWGWRTTQRGGRWGDLVVLGLIMVLVAGVRPQSAVALLPWWGFVFWECEAGRLRKFLTVSALVAVLSLGWVVPMVNQSGGLRVYLEIIHLYQRTSAPLTFAGGGWSALTENLLWAELFSLNGLMLGALSLAGAIGYRFFRWDAPRRQAWRNRAGRAMTFLAWWGWPLFLFGTLVQFTVQPGYVLGYLAPLVLLSAVGLARLRSTATYALATTLVVGGNLFAFLAWPPAWDCVFHNETRTARELSTHDAQLRQAIAAIRAHADPARAVVCHAILAHFLFGFRHFQLYLPEFEQYQLALDPTLPTPPGRPFWHARQGQLDFAAIDFTGSDRVLLVVPPGLTLEIFREWFPIARAEPLAGSGGTVYALAVGPAAR